MNHKVLICMVGLPKSGKSTWSRGQGLPIVNPDSVRLALHGCRFLIEAEPFVWAIVRVMVKSLFFAGHNMAIVDATHTTRKSRDAWKSRECDTYYKLVDTPKEECITRALKENDLEILPVIERMAVQWEPLGEDESRWQGEA